MNIEIKKVGGIGNATIFLTDGVNLLTGRNATDRTSALSAIMTALGSDRASLKGDAKERSVRLEYDGSRYTRQLQPAGG
jgi:recombinational DNA repair ATPase RecF